MKKIVIILTIILIIGSGIFVIKKNNKKNNEPELEALSLKTSGGVVLVGIIKKDENDWYFLPEQPLNLTLNHEEFNQVTKIKIDGNLNKTLYADEYVTISGEIVKQDSNLSLFLYNIKPGKQVRISYDEPNIKALEGNFKETNKNDVPAKMQSSIENGEYKYNFYMLSEESINFFDNNFIEFYLDFVEAFLNYKTSVKCPERSYADYLFNILDYEFPLFFADGTYDYANNYDAKNNLVSWNYTTKNKEEHDYLIENFEVTANNLLKGVKEDQSQNLKARIIYQNLISKVKYDYIGVKNKGRLESYYVYTEQKGTYHSLALTYTQLLTQVGIDSTIVVATNKNNLSHAWVAMKIDDTYYFSDPTYEILKGSSFYGINLLQRENNGEYNKDDILIGKYVLKPLNEYGEFKKSLEIININKD